MAILNITKAKSKTSKGKWFTFEVEEIKIIDGIVYLLPVNKEYSYHRLLLSNCIIIK